MLGLLCTACSGRRTAGSNGVDGVAQYDSFLPLPDVPRTITSPSARAEYLLLHFWDDMSFCDTIVSHDEEYIERNFVNYLSLFPHADSTALTPAISKLIHYAKEDNTTLAIITEMAEKYLSDPASPMRNDDYYLTYLDVLLTTEGIEAEQLLRPRLQRAKVLKNHRGTIATDFRCVTREGLPLTLHSISVEEGLILIFYDPACGHCMDILHTIAESIVVNNLVDAGRMMVLAVYTEGDKELWDKTKNSLPAAWTVAIDASEIVSEGLYNLPAMPTIYLLDSDKRVLLKDPPTIDLEEYLLLRL